jgi:hypothetical protein
MSGLLKNKLNNKLTLIFRYLGNQQSAAMLNATVLKRFTSGDFIWPVRRQQSVAMQRMTQL